MLFVKCDYFIHYVEICSRVNIVILILGFKKRRKRKDMNEERRLTQNNKENSESYGEELMIGRE